MVGKYFLLVCSLFFHPFNRVLNRSKFFNLDEDQCNDVSVYSFENFTFGVKSKNFIWFWILKFSPLFDFHFFFLFCLGHATWPSAILVP